MSSLSSPPLLPSPSLPPSPSAIDPASSISTPSITHSTAPMASFKLDPSVMPTFSGAPSESVVNWLDDWEVFFETTGVPRSLARHRLFLLSRRLAGSAQGWFDNLKSSSDPCLDSWDAFTGRLSEAFKPSNQRHCYEDELAALSQESLPFETLTSRFLFLTRVLGTEEATSVWLFKSKLLPGIRNRIRTTDPEPMTLDATIASARHHERFREVQTISPPPTPSQPPQLPPIPSGVKLTQDWVSFLRTANGCSYCRQYGHLVDSCPRSKNFAAQRK